jgi:hypothetical protein
MSSWTYEQYGGGWAAYSYVFLDWDNGQRFPTKEDAERAVETFILSRTETGREILDRRRAETFWERARCTNTYRAADKRATSERALYGKSLVRVRRWKDPETGEVRKTVEIECND